MLSLETRERLWGSSPWSVLAGKALWHQCAGRRPRAQRALRSLGVPGKRALCSLGVPGRAAGVGGITSPALTALPAAPGAASWATQDSTRAERKEGPVGAWGLCTPADPDGDAPPSLRPV